MTKPKRLISVQSLAHISAGNHVRDDKHIDWNNSSDRKWLMNHLHWAMHNKVEVTLAPLF